MEKCQSDCFVRRIHKFLCSVQNVYRESWVARSVSRDNVIRGRAHCIAGYVEDLFAETVYDILKKHIEDLLVFVDLPLCYIHDNNGLKQKAICYPDVVVARKNGIKIEILYLLEVKVNLGWGRHKLSGEEKVKNEKGIKECRKVVPIEEDLKNELEALVKATDVTSKPPFCMKLRKLSNDLNNQGMENSEKLQFEISKYTRYDLVICSSKNVPKAALAKARERIVEKKSAACQMYILSDSELSLKYVEKSKECGGNLGLCSSDVKRWQKRIDTLVKSIGG